MNLLTKKDIDKIKKEFGLTGEWTCFFKSIDIEFCKELDNIRDSVSSSDLYELFPLDVIDIRLPKNNLLIGIRNIKTSEDLYKVIEL